MEATLLAESDQLHAHSSSSPASTEGPEVKADLHDQIRTVAYQLYEGRGRDDGHDLDDWLKAEALVLSEPERARAA